MSSNSMKKPPTGSLALEPPQFLLEKEIRQEGFWGWAAPTMTTLLLLAVFWLLIPVRPMYVPSLWVLLAVSVGAGGLYHGVRFLCYWAIWTCEAGKRKPTATIQPGAQGELPKTGFILIVSIPTVAAVLVFIILSFWGLARAPEYWLAIAVVAGIAFQDIRTLRHLLPLGPGYWIKETSRGLHILKLVE